ncbi:hypothetical protein L209DRAFT_415589 [Thermothelomyces heterothallicus CBS 203.75]
MSPVVVSEPALVLVYLFLFAVVAMGVSKSVHGAQEAVFLLNKASQHYTDPLFAVLSCCRKKNLGIQSGRRNIPKHLRS